MRLTEFLQGAGRYVMYYPSLVNITGSVSATIFLCNLIGWEGNQESTEGWIYKTREQMQEETGLTRHEQDHARRLLVTAGLMDEARKGVPGRMHYRLNLDAINDAWDAYHANKIAGKRQCAVPQSGNVKRRDPAKQNATKRQSITEATAESTTEKTQKEGTAARGGAPSARFSPLPPVPFVPSPERTEANIERIKRETMTWDEVRAKHKKASVR